VHDVAGYTPNGCANLWLRTEAVTPLDACE